jgi:hypothetical protein
MAGAPTRICGKRPARGADAADAQAPCETDPHESTQRIIHIRKVLFAFAEEVRARRCGRLRRRRRTDAGTRPCCARTHSSPRLALSSKNNFSSPNPA